MKTYIIDPTLRQIKEIEMSGEADEIDNQFKKIIGCEGTVILAFPKHDGQSQRSKSKLKKDGPFKSGMEKKERYP